MVSRNFGTKINPIDGGQLAGDWNPFKITSTLAWSCVKTKGIHSWLSIDTLDRPLINTWSTSPLHLSITYGLLSSKLHEQNKYVFPTIDQCSEAPPSFRLCCLNCAPQIWIDYCTLGSCRKLREQPPPNIWLTVAKNTFVGWALNFSVRML